MSDAFDIQDGLMRGWKISSTFQPTGGGLYAVIIGDNARDGEAVSVGPFTAEGSKDADEDGLYVSTPDDTVSVSSVTQIVALMFEEVWAEDALNAACLSVQTAMGVDAGDAAGLFFSGVTGDRFKSMMREYIRFQAQWQ